MTNGPPPSAAGTSAGAPQAQPSPAPQQPQTTYYAAPGTSQIAYQRYTWSQQQQQAGRQYQTTPTFNAARGMFTEQQYAQGRAPAAQQPTPPPIQTQVQAPPRAPSEPLSPLTPPPAEYRHWDRVIRDFMVKMGLRQALHGFESDLLLMNEDFERANVLDAMMDAMQGFLQIQEGVELPEADRSLEERKVDYVHTSDPSPQSSITKSISAFLAQNRAKKDASNRAEFLVSLAEKRQRLGDEAAADDLSLSSCARTDAKPADRDIQMKFQIAQNIETPLQRTVKGAAGDSVAAATPAMSPTTLRSRTKSLAREEKKAETVEAEEKVHSGLQQRLQNIETHFAVRYVPGPPDNFLTRLQFLEQHIIRLEKDYPPWAALHFNQPNRGWPPPPRATPITVPSDMRSAASAGLGQMQPPKNGPPRMKNANSSM
ncbi:hypothetical protein MKEN_00712800 [Mycena kentingensis (nom. inval.)]|nr:hypothetical protein MKEN_00712800 [Mycena kentingensis (nom. inval.)]